MAEHLSIPLAKIHVGDRVRPIDEEEAQIIAVSLTERGLINPITVRKAPAANGGKTPFILVAGGNRLRAAQINGWDEIDAVVVQADAEEAQLIELSENLYRNELSALDRAVFVMKYREIWEEKHGKINPNGGRPKKQDHDDPVFCAGLELSKRVQDRLGFGPASYKRVSRIGQNLRPELRALLRGTATADDQSQLLKLVKMSAEDQLRIAAALKEGADLKQVLSWTKPAKPAVDPQENIFEKVKALLAKAEDATLLRVLHHIGDLRDFSELEDAA
ncbi:ParB N-terminal domain-containing protein [Rhizobium sp. YJ-22]|uniref:ParB N-terminal domain-containing protein n=1 Tax=Rhizobium sp. YJ-22 TaxID=3037556 RepID=UPI002412E526|nr:ParB N-terminal domain-containing protein [Rhizobium sp. YJ-22]MDG3580381.1 ParB N-terminal domain-containing protein [Rhizobium sp. YJ-22]